VGTPEVTSCFALKTLYLGQAIFNAAIFGRLHGIATNKQMKRSVSAICLLVAL